MRLPGRENRVGEPAVVDPEAVAEAMDADRDDRPYALFGHSMGGLLAFEVARLLSRTGAGPAHLTISGSPHPLLAAPLEAISTLPADELLAWLRETGGAPEQVLADPAYHPLLLVPLRADCAWREAYAHRPAAALRCPVTVLAGADDPHVTDDSLRCWETETTGTCVVRRYPGGHMYLFDHLPAVLADLTADLRTSVTCEAT